MKGGFRRGEEEARATPLPEREEARPLGNTNALWWAVRSGGEANKGGGGLLRGGKDLILVSEAYI